MDAKKKYESFVEREITIPQQEEFIFTTLADGLSKGRVIRPVQTITMVLLYVVKILLKTQVMKMRENFKRPYK